MQANKILILEDELIVALDLQELLSDEGYEVQVAHSFSKAMDELKKFKPHVIICDINLGEIKTGIDFAKEAKEVHKPVEIIFISAFSTKQILDDAERTFPLNYIVKPWNNEQIKVTVQMAFNFIEGKQNKNEAIKFLTHIEFKILELIAQQKTSGEIATMLFLSEKTIRNHRYNIKKKINLTNENNSLLKWAIANI